MKKALLFVCLLSYMLLSGCAAVVVGSGAAAVAVDKRTAGDMLEDENIEIKFSYHLSQDESLSNVSHINATSYNGWLLLSGETATEENRQAIYNIAINIKNVDRVFNEIVIDQVSSIGSRTSDTYLTSKVKTQLFTIKNTPSFHTKVVTERGVVYLMGLISKEQADQAVELVRKISGVKKIVKLFDYQ